MASHLPKIEVFVGRNDVLEQIQAGHWNLMNGHGQVLFVAGEAGIGKTTVVNHFLDSLLSTLESPANHADTRILVLRAKCSPLSASSSPYSPFAELLDGLPTMGHGKVKERIGEWVRHLGPKLLEGVVPYLGPLLAEILQKQMGVHEQRLATTPVPSQTYQFLQLLEGLSTAFPLILFIDDLHWADEASINLLFAIARRIADWRILLIGTYRPHDIAERPGYPAHPFTRVLLEMRRYGLCNEILLEQFTFDEAETYLDSHFPNNRFTAGMKATLYRETSGNPFFIDQVVRLLVEQGIIFFDTDHLWSAKSLDTIPIPKGVQAIIEARFQNLDDRSRLLLSYASVLGEQFRSRILAEILGEGHLDTLRTLRLLERDHHLVRQRIEPERSEVRPNWEFKHAFVHDKLYSMLAVDELRELHNSVATAIESQFAESKWDLAAELAYHYEIAKRYEKAAACRVIAAQRANGTQSYTEQAVHCEKGIADVEQLAPNQVNLRDAVLLLSGLCHACRRLMYFDKEEQIAFRLLQVADESGDVLAGVESHWALAHLNAMRADKEGVRTHVEKAWNIARESNAAHHLVRVASLVEYGFKCVPELDEHLDETITFCRQRDAPALLAKAIECRGILAFLDGENEQALSLFREAVAIAQHVEESDKQLFADYPFAGSLYSPHWFVSNCFEYIGRIHRHRGEWHDAVANFRQVYEHKESVKNLPGMAGLLNVIAETQLLAGEKEIADRSFQQSWHIAQQCESLELKAMILSTGISIGLELNNLAQVKQRLELFEDAIRHWDSRWTWHVVQMTRGILSMRADNTDEATRLLSSGLARAEEESELGLIAKYNLHLAALSLQCGKLDLASSYSEAALRISKEFGLWELGDAQLMLARIELKSGSTHEARLSVERAIEYFQGKNLLHKALYAHNLKHVIEMAAC